MWGWAFQGKMAAQPTGHQILGTSRSVKNQKNELVVLKSFGDQLVGGAITILKNMKVNGKDDNPYMMENKKMCETTNQPGLPSDNLLHSS